MRASSSVDDYGSYGTAPTTARRRTAQLLALVGVCGLAAVAGYFAGAGTGSTAAAAAAANVVMTPGSPMTVAEAEAASLADFGEVTVETIKAEATLNKYGVRLAEATTEKAASGSGDEPLATDVWCNNYSSSQDWRQHPFQGNLDLCSATCTAKPWCTVFLYGIRNDDGDDCVILHECPESERRSYGKGGGVHLYARQGAASPGPGPSPPAGPQLIAEDTWCNGNQLKRTNPFSGDLNACSAECADYSECTEFLYGTRSDGKVDCVLFSSCPASNRRSYGMGGGVALYAQQGSTWWPPTTPPAGPSTSASPGPSSSASPGPSPSAGPRLVAGHQLIADDTWCNGNKLSRDDDGDLNACSALCTANDACTRFLYGTRSDGKVDCALFSSCPASNRRSYGMGGGVALYARQGSTWTPPAGPPLIAEDTWCQHNKVERFIPFSGDVNACSAKCRAHAEMKVNGVPRNQLRHPFIPACEVFLYGTRSDGQVDCALFSRCGPSSRTPYGMGGGVNLYAMGESGD